MHKLILIFTFVSLSCVAFTNTGYSAVPRGSANERATVAAVAQNYMDAYYSADVNRMEQAIHPDFHKRTLQLKDGHIELVQDTGLSLLEGVRGGSGRDIPVKDRVQRIEVLDIYNDAASVKVVTGRWVDYMLLSKLDGKWRVLDVVLQYTRK